MLATWLAQNRKYIQSNYVDEEIFFFFFYTAIRLDVWEFGVKENVVNSCCLVQELP